MEYYITADGIYYEGDKINIDDILVNTQRPGPQYSYVDNQWIFDNNKAKELITKKCNLLLGECDWTQLFDCNLTDVQMLECLMYRKQLYEMPDICNLENPVYPTKPDFLNEIADIYILGSTSIRDCFQKQIILKSVCDSNGRSNFLEAGTGLAVTLKATESNPFVFSISRKNSSISANLLKIINSDIENGWNSLPANSTLYLFIEINTDNDDEILYRYSTTAPSYGYSKTGTGFEFLIPEMAFYENNVNKNIIFVGEVVTDASSVTSVRSYAVLGRWDSGIQSVSSGNSYDYNHNIGCDLLEVLKYERQNSTKMWNCINKEYVNLLNLTRHGSAISINRLAVNVDYSDATFVGSPYTHGNASFASSSTSGELRVIIRRAF